MADVAVYNQNGTPAVQNGAVEVGTVNNSKTEAILLHTGLVQDKMNNIIQFTIDNTGAGATNQLLRIGSLCAEPDAYAYYNLVEGASDDTVIKDQFGVGCLAVVGFSRLVTCKPCIASLIKVQSSDTAQLNQPIKYRSVQPDGSIDEIVQNIAFTADKSDNRTNLIEKPGIWVLDAQQFIEYRVLAGKQVDIFLELTGFANSVVFNKLLMR